MVGQLPSGACAYLLLPSTTKHVQQQGKEEVCPAWQPPWLLSAQPPSWSFCTMTDIWGIKPEQPGCQGLCSESSTATFSPHRSINFRQHLITVTQLPWVHSTLFTDSCHHRKSPTAAAGGNGTVWECWWYSYGQVNTLGAFSGPEADWLSMAYVSHHWNLLSFPTWCPKTVPMSGLPLGTC